MQGYLITPLYLIISIFICTLLCCGEPSMKSANGDINPSVRANIIRYDSLMLGWNEGSITTDLKTSQDLSPAFHDLFIHQILALPREQDIINQEVIRMVNDTGFHRLVMDVGDSFEDFEGLQKELNQLLQNYQEIFGVDKTPNVYTFISGFVYQCFVFDDIDRDGIGIGLDMFLGADFPYDQINPSNPAFSSYLTQFYDQEHMVKKVAEVLIEDRLPPPDKSDFLSLMIWGGKKLYLIDQLLPFKSDAVIMEYTPAQYEWCQQNESQMWDLFFEQSLFYETDIRKFNKLIAPSPTSPGMPPESPGRTANYMGWQVIKKYMTTHPTTSIEQLTTLIDAQLILDKSNYKPRRA